MKKPTITPYKGPSGRIYEPWWCHYTYSYNLSCDTCNQTSECRTDCPDCAEDFIQWNIQEDKRLYENDKQDYDQIINTGTWSASSGKVYTLVINLNEYPIRKFQCPVCKIIAPVQNEWCKECEADAIEWNNRGLGSFPLNIT